MTLKKSTLLLTIIILLLITFTGCSEVNINTGIDDDNSAYLSYVIKVDLSSIDSMQIPSVVSTMNMVLNHYEKELDFEILKKDVNLLQSECLYELEKRIPCDNYELAFNTLKDMLTDEKITPFMQVDMTSMITKYQQLYSFNGELDFAAIYKATNIGSFPQYMQDSINQNFEASFGKINICLPGTDIETATNNGISLDNKTYISGDQISMSVPFKFNQKAAFTLSTRLSSDNEKVIKKPMRDVLQSINVSLYFSIAIGVIAIIIIGVGIGLHFSKTKHKDEVQNENHFI